MADSIPALRHRIKTAEDMGSVVKTMKAMAAASISQFEQATAALGGYSESVNLALSVYFRQNSSDQAANLSHPDEGRDALLVFGTDQGMAGQFNESLATEIVSRFARAPAPPLIWTVGERIQYRLEDSGLPVARVFSTPNSIDAVAPLISEVLREIEEAWFHSRLSVVEFCHNYPLSRINYDTRWGRLLPLDRNWENSLRDLPWPTNYLPELIHESPGTLASLISEYLFVSLFKACTESVTAENGARLSAMQRAEKNIDERLREFSLAFNRQRQKAIDEELFDLVSGFEALTID